MFWFNGATEIVMLLYATVFTTNVMVLPQLLLEKLCFRNDDFNNSLCLDQSAPQLQKEGSKWWFYIILTNHIPSLFIIFIWGPITHRIGRRKSVVFIAVINAIQAIVYLVNAHFIGAHPGFLLIGSILTSLYGEFQGVILFTYACIADDTSNKSRTMRMALIESIPVLSGLFSGLVAGQILQRFGFISVFAFVISLDIIIFIFAILFLPGKADTEPCSSSSDEHPLICESTEENSDAPTEDNLVDNKPDVNHSQDLVSMNPFYYLKDSLHILMEPKYRRTTSLLLLAVGFTISGIMGEVSVQVLYLKNNPFLFSPKEIGYYFTAVALIRGFGCIIITQISYHCCHMSDYVLIFIGQVSQFVCYISIGFSRSTWSIFLSNITGCFMFVTLAAIRSLITKTNIDISHGSMLASVEAFDLLFDLISGTLTLWIYNLVTELYTGIVFFMLSGFSLLSFLCILGSMYMSKNK